MVEAFGVGANPTGEVDMEAAGMEEAAGVSESDTPRKLATVLSA